LINFYICKLFEQYEQDSIEGDWAIFEKSLRHWEIQTHVTGVLPVKPMPGSVALLCCVALLRSFWFVAFVALLLLRSFGCVALLRSFFVASLIYCVCSFASIPPSFHLIIYKKTGFTPDDLLDAKRRMDEHTMNDDEDHLGYDMEGPDDNKYEDEEEEENEADDDNADVDRDALQFVREFMEDELIGWESLVEKGDGGGERQQRRGRGQDAEQEEERKKGEEEQRVADKERKMERSVWEMDVDERRTFWNLITLRSKNISYSSFCFFPLLK
jgi:hypothetical protein